ncbi:hypothetical protein GCM10023318_16340 [Nocardia callitridis]|uniref:Uncharacterized protein n=1 Tax=Nocardia callitridis TaxID=648753 RepID=A0ABP9K3V9_9NOCA
MTDDGAGSGPWIFWSHCGSAKFDPRTNRITEIACPAPCCAMWVPLVEDMIVEHRRIDGTPCHWHGIRVIDDRGAAR